MRGRVAFLPGEISPWARKGHAEERSEKSAEVVVVAAKRGEGPNGEESETDVRLRDKQPQMSRQLELPLGSRDEVPRAGRSAEVSKARHEDERSGASGLLELVCEHQNLLAASK